MNRSRMPIVITLILSLLAAGAFRQWAQTERATGVGAAHLSGSAKLSSMNSFALGLLLGGLRGPLVMFLWPSAESQKQEKNLEDFDTKIEWIRLLQAEFDTVHIFQIWNKAYNISVQMANLGNKYRTILDALDYAHRTDAEKPNDINIIGAIGQIFFDKFANSNEKTYYRQRVRDDTSARQEMVRLQFPTTRAAEVTQLAIDDGVLPRQIVLSDNGEGQASTTLPKRVVDQMRDKLGAGVTFQDRPYLTGGTRSKNGSPGELPPMLDDQGNILAKYLTVKEKRPADLAPAAEWNDGSELQYLKKYEPFPYGLSPWALGYNYWKRAEVLQNVNHQKHAQLSELVVDSRPGLALEFWAAEENERGRHAEIDAFAKAQPEGEALETPAADVPLDAKVDRPASMAEALYSYKRSAELCTDSLGEFQRHLANDSTNLGTYLSHIDELNAEHELMLADSSYLQALSGTANRAANITEAREHYQTALRRYDLILLTYTVSDNLIGKIFPPGVDRSTLSKANLSTEQLEAMAAKLKTALPVNMLEYEHNDDYQQYSVYLIRIRTRLALLPPPPSTQKSAEIR